MADGKINLKSIKTEVDKVGSIKAETATIKTATDEIANIKTATDKIVSIKDATDEITNIKTATDKIANIENKVGTMEAKIQALERLVGTHDQDDSKNDTGIYGAIYKGFNDLIGEP
ncbi:hypothetical protein [Candidatus Mesenet endosymbiont of Phosphuga atrata]|uniref:hypothetical protein n=1 Tax=Candidatus Mesenet endosymbiont of Phosphuga atrata TaxID=3066221 RepID=UPI0030CCC5AB